MFIHTDTNHRQESPKYFHTEGLVRSASNALSALKRPAQLSLAALMLIASGCDKPLQERVLYNPKPTVDDIVKNPKAWIHREVTLEGPVVYSSRSEVEVARTGKYAMHVRGQDYYKLIQVNAGATNSITLINNWSSPNMRVVSLPEIQVIAQKNRLADSTFVVTGTLRKFLDSESLYLEVDGSMYR